jgi:hypothetical protein
MLQELRLPSTSSIPFSPALFTCTAGAGPSPSIFVSPELDLSPVVRNSLVCETSIGESFEAGPRREVRGRARRIAVVDIIWCGFDQKDKPCLKLGGGAHHPQQALVGSFFLDSAITIP